LKILQKDRHLQELLIWVNPNTTKNECPDTPEWDGPGRIKTMKNQVSIFLILG